MIVPPRRRASDQADIYRFTMPMSGHFYGRLRAYNNNAEIALLQKELPMLRVISQVPKPRAEKDSPFSLN